MQARFLSLPLAALLLSSTILPGRCDSLIRMAIQKAYDDADAAANRKDANGASNRFGNPQLKAQANSSLSRLLQAVDSPNFSTRVVWFAQPSGNKQEAIVVIKQHFQGILAKSHRGSAALIASEGEFREFWAVNNGQWQTMRSRLLSIHRTLNGHSVKSW
jgi:hypothetical protein